MLWLLLAFVPASAASTQYGEDARPKVFVQCAVVQGNGYNWASTLGWLSGQVELAAVRAGRYAAANPGRAAVLDLSCLTGSSSGLFVGAVLDHLLSNTSIVGQVDTTEPRLVSPGEAREISRALMFLALSSNFSGEGFQLVLTGIGAYLGLLDRQSNAANAWFWRGSSTAERNLLIFGHWVRGARLYSSDWFSEMQSAAGVGLPVISKLPRTLGPSATAAAESAMENLSREARRILDANTSGQPIDEKPVGNGFCVTAFALPIEVRSLPFDYEDLRLSFVCNEATSNAARGSRHLLAWLVTRTQMAGNIILAQNSGWFRLANMSVREPDLMTTLSGEFDMPPIGMDDLAVLETGAFNEIEDVSDVLVFGGFAGPRLQAWVASAILLERVERYEAHGYAVDGRLALFGRTEERENPTSSFAQQTMVRYFTDYPQTGDFTSVQEALNAYYAWQDEFCEITDALGSRISDDYYRMNWNLGGAPGAIAGDSHILAAKGYNTGKLQTPRDQYPGLGQGFFSAYLFDPIDDEQSVPSPPAVGMKCRLQERGI